MQYKHLFSFFVLAIVSAIMLSCERQPIVVEPEIDGSLYQNKSIVGEWYSANDIIKTDNGEIVYRYSTTITDNTIVFCDRADNTANFTGDVQMSRNFLVITSKNYQNDTVSTEEIFNYVLYDDGLKLCIYDFFTTEQSGYPVTYDIYLTRKSDN